MVFYNRLTIDEILSMYEPGQRYLLDTNLAFPILKSKLWFPMKSKYSSMKEDLIQSEELDDVSRQAIILLYRAALLKKEKAFPQLNYKQIKNLEDIFIIDRKHANFRIFDIPRHADVYTITARHNDIRELKGNYSVNYNIGIDKFYNADFEGTIMLNDNHKYTTGSRKIQL